MDRREQDGLDRHITGNYGENQFPPDMHDNEELEQAGNAMLGPMTDTEAIVALGNVLQGFSKAGYHVLGGPRGEVLLQRASEPWDLLAQASWNHELNLWAVSDLRHELKDLHKRDYLDDEGADDGA